MFARIPFKGDLENDEALMAVVHDNPHCRLELSRDGKILVSPLTGTATAPKEMEAYVQLRTWASVAGGKAYGPSAGFRLPDKSVLGPDASWISSERLEALAPADTEKAFWRVCPDVVLEVMAEYDTWPELMRKINRFIKNGARYAVAIDPEQRRVYELGTRPDGLRLDFDSIFDA